MNNDWDFAHAAPPIVHQCATHRRYQAKRKPRVPCEGCWRMWIKAHP